MVRHGIGYVPEGRHVFVGLSVEKNLLLGAYARPWNAATRAGLDEVYELFPMLRDMRGRLAGALSGGQQQMLAIGRALMCQPRLLLLDEPSMGLSPKLVEDILAVLQRLSKSGLSMLLVEQNAKLTFEATASCLVVARTAPCAISGTSQELSTRSTRTQDLSGPLTARIADSHSPVHTGSRRARRDIYQALSSPWSRYPLVFTGGFAAWALTTHRPGGAERLSADGAPCRQRNRRGPGRPAPAGAHRGDRRAAGRLAVRATGAVPRRRERQRRGDRRLPDGSGTTWTGTPAGARVVLERIDDQLARCPPCVRTSGSRPPSRYLR
jgi:energy-coupling factor transporter ATP-binding protein EcfA2